MIANNTILAIAVGAGLVGVALLLRHIMRGERFSTEGWAALFGVTGLITFVVGMLTIIMWPYGTAELAYANIEFGEPAVGFGALLLFAAVFLYRHRGLRRADADDEPGSAFVEALRPVSIFVGFLGIGMAFLAFAWVRFQMGAAPEVEPVSGNFGQWPWLEAIFLGGLWGLVAVGAILFPFALRRPEGGLMKAVVWLWLVAGVVFALFGALNLYTHIGMYYNVAHHTKHRW